jgi:hypothetical protein
MKAIYRKSIGEHLAMRTGQTIIKNNPNAGQITTSDGDRTGGWLSRLFGCRHKEMSRPFSFQGQAYRTCLDCGARRKFNLNRWEMQGSFYYCPPNYLEPISLGTR